MLRFRWPKSPFPKILFAEILRVRLSDPGGKATKNQHEKMTYVHYGIIDRHQQQESHVRYENIVRFVPEAVPPYVKHDVRENGIK